MSTALANGVGNLLGANRVGPARTLAVAATGGGLAIIAIYVSGALALGILFRPPTHFSHMSHPTFPISHR